MENDLNHVNTLLEQMFDEIKDAITKGDNDKIKKIIHSIDPPDASYDNDDTKVKMQRTEVFKYALRLNDFSMVEMLYDYWSGDLHWIGHDKSKLKTLGQLLEDARVVCEVKNQQLLIDIHSLITFNAFQQTLYSKISPDQNLPNTTPKGTASMLVEVLCLYDTYSDLEKIRIPQKDEAQERKLKADFADTSSEYMKGQAYIKYEVYFRKLDLNVALLILENLFVIRQNFKNKFNEPQQINQGEVSFKDEADKYKEIECALYHFIYRTAEDWRLYLPGTRQLTVEMHHDLILTFDEDKLFNGSVLFLERKYFSKSLKELKILIEKHFSNSAHNTDQDPINLNDNYLTPTYMSDYYSLSKIVYYIGAIEDAEDVNVLIIERVLQVTGEMIKSSKGTNHLLESTKSLLQIGIPVDTISYLQYIRDYMSHVYRGQLSTRIDIANQQAHIYFDDNIKKDLKDIKKIINSIRDIYKPIVDKSLLEKGLLLLNERIGNLPEEALRHLNLICKNYKKLVNENDFLFKEIRAHTGLRTQLFKEIICIVAIKDDILSKINKLETTISEKVVSILPTYIHHIRQTQTLMTENKKKVKKLNSQLRRYNITLSVNPNLEEINKIKRALGVIKERNKEFNVDLLQSLVEIKDYSRRLEAMLSFCLDNVCELLVLKVPKRLLKDSLDLPTVNNIITELENKYGKHSSLCNNSPTNYSFDGIKKLHDIFKEKKAESIQHKNSQQTREKLISCLFSRMNLLKNNLEYMLQIHLEHIAPSPSDQLLRSYKDNLKFRFELEMILADISNILVNCGIKNLMNKSSKLLRQINLSNVLDHGDTFLDVIGDFFDSYDLSTELLSKAIMFAKDGESIEALFELFKGNVDYDTIEKGKLEEMNDQQKKFYEKFQMSPRWEDYVKLVPTDTQTTKK